MKRVFKGSDIFKPVLIIAITYLAPEKLLVGS